MTSLIVAWIQRNIYLEFVYDYLGFVYDGCAGNVYIVMDVLVT